MTFILAAVALISCSESVSEAVPYAVIGDSIPQVLTHDPPNAERGAKLFGQRGDAHCVLCHKHEKISAEFQGDLGPDLTGLGDRLTTPQIRLRIADYDRFKPGTTMPSYFRTDRLNNIDPKFSGKTVLTALEIEDIIAFLVEDDNAK